jgi:hypothetical protein
MAPEILTVGATYSNQLTLLFARSFTISIHQNVDACLARYRKARRIGNGAPK